MEVNRAASFRVGGSMNRETATSREFRVRKPLQRLAVVFLVVCSLAMIGTAVGMAVDPPPNPAVPVPVLTAIFVSFWGVFAAGATWMLLACRYSVLAIDEYGITQQGIRSRRSVEFSEVTELQWRVAPRGVVIQASARRLKIDLPDFVPEERLWIIRAFRSRIDATQQTGWDPFCRAVANPIRRCVEEPVRPLQADEVQLNRGRIDRLSVIATLLSLLLAGLLAAILRRPSLLLLAIAPAVLGVMFRFTIPKEGVRDRRLQGPHLHLITGLGILTGTALLANALRSNWGVLVVVGLMVVWMVRFDIRDRRERLRAEADETPRALQEWDANEGLG